MTAQRVGPRWHDARRAQLLEDHPEVRALMGPNPWTAVAIVVLATLQLSLGAFLASFAWWVGVVAAVVAGAVVAHALGVLIHEATHDLVFRAPLPNRLIAMVANVPLVFPAAMDFRSKHLKHHAHLGEPDGADTQAPQSWDFRFVTNGVRRFVWHAMGPILTHSDAATHPTSRWVFVNVAVCVVAMVPYAWAFGFKALLFLGVSGVLAFGHTPVGVRRYGEHLTLRQGQPTVSYYGPLNWLSFDVGYHVEHHDLPSVPWNHLRAVRAMAPALYEPLASLRSWSALLWQLTTRAGEGPEKYFLERRPRQDDAHHPAVPHGR